MRHHSIICRLGETDDQDLALLEPGSVITNIQFLDRYGRLQYGIGQAIEQLADLGLSPGETAVDLALLAATLTAADTRISRDTESENSWTREIDLYVPVADPALWIATSDMLASTLKFLTGDRWRLIFRERPLDIDELSPTPESLRTDESDSVCLFSGDGQFHWGDRSTQWRRQAIACEPLLGHQQHQHLSERLPGSAAGTVFRDIDQPRPGPCGVPTRPRGGWR